MPKFLIEWNGHRFPVKVANKTRIERYLKNPAAFGGARLLDCATEDIAAAIANLQNSGDEYAYGDEPIEVINEKDETECEVALYSVHWEAVRYA